MINSSNYPTEKVNRDNPEVGVSDNDVLGELVKVLKELKKANVYNAMAHNQELNNEDI